MDSSTMRALLVSEQNGSFTKSIQELPISFLSSNDVLIRVHYAGLNYKDALSANGHKGITKTYPHIPGVDASGVVVNDRSGVFKKGDLVICTSHDLGMNTNGGFAEYISVPSSWVIPLPKGMTLLESMALGTAAFTAALAIYKMERNGQNPESGEIVVTGSTGGVGSMAIAILKKKGYAVVAATGKDESHQWLSNMGASRCISRREVDDQSGRPLLSARWAGAIDNVGGNTLVTLLKSCKKEGNVASIGLVSSPELKMTVYPFILNGVNLLGVDSAEIGFKLRNDLWDLLSNEWKPMNIEQLCTIVKLEEIPSYMEKILKGETLGRVVAKLHEQSDEE